MVDSNHKGVYPSQNHGGQLSQASERYGIPLVDWLDLSTGISPFTYPLPSVPDECWQRLPETNDGLENIAADYYGSEFLLPVSGSQEAIQKLPLLFAAPLNVGIIMPAYHSHQQAWQNAGHNIVLLAPTEIESSISSLDVLLVVNPTNPSGLNYSHDELSRWHQQLNIQNGFLIIDEAFIDMTPEQSLIKSNPKAGLIVLRSVGKFFGLAGIRLGFIWAEKDILHKLAMLQEDWSVSNPARWAGKIALADSDWQQQQRSRLSDLSLRLKNLLQDFLAQYDSQSYAIRGATETTKESSDADPKGEVKPNKSGGVSYNSKIKSISNSVKYTALFAYFEHPDAPLIHDSLAKQGILIRLFKKSITQATGHKENALRFGLPATEHQWQRLQQALNQISNTRAND